MEPGEAHCRRGRLTAAGGAQIVEGTAVQGEIDLLKAPVVAE